MNLGRLGRVFGKLGAPVKAGTGGGGGGGTAGEIILTFPLITKAS